MRSHEIAMKSPRDRKDRADVAEPSLAASLKDDDRAEGYTPDYS